MPQPWLPPHSTQAGKKGGITNQSGKSSPLSWLLLPPLLRVLGEGEARSERDQEVG